MTTTGADDPLEDETCRRFVLPRLAEAGWDETRIRAAYPVNRGRIRATAHLHRQDRPLIADYVLEHSDGLPLAVIEAKRSSKDPADGLEQVKRYARLLDVPFAYATNGRRTLELDARAGLLTEIGEFPSPEELWDRYKDERDLTLNQEQDRLAAADFDAKLRNWDGTPKQPRYYQQVAINRAVQAIARGDTRLLLVLATGTGKTLVAAQIVAKLWNSNWCGEHKPRVLYLADRKILIDQAKDEYFQPMFGEAVTKLGGGSFPTSRHIYFALYQALDSGRADRDETEEPSPYRQFPPDFFDLVIVDECHRSSATDGSQWRAILEYFAPAVQIGLTATPISKKDASTYQYFGEPRYEYSLARGIDDGFLAPYRVRRVRMNVDLTGWQPEPGQRDLRGQEIPERLYYPWEYERLLAILERTEEAAKYLTEYLRRTDRMGKTIVFCQDIEHASRMTRALHNANSDLVRSHGQQYVCRITGADGDPGRENLDEFRRVDTEVPTIAVTSRLLTTGVDIPTLRNVVLFRVIRSMPEFKQIIGRGTRLFPEDNKYSFDIIDFVEATRLFNDPLFDGPPMRLLRDVTDEDGHIVDTISDEVPDADIDSVAEPQGDYTEKAGGTLPPEVTDEDAKERLLANPRKFYVNGVDVVPAGTAFYIYDPDTGGLKLKEFSQFVRDQMLSLRLEPYELLNRWAHVKSRKELRKHLDDWHITVEDLAEWTGRPDADAVDLLLNVAWQVPLLSRAERARRVETRQKDFLGDFSSIAERVLATMLEQYAKRGADEVDVAALQADVYRPMGTIVEIAGHFGGTDGLQSAVDKLGALLYSPA
jgi:type I restriction enzyme, R subunit